MASIPLAAVAIKKPCPFKLRRGKPSKCLLSSTSSIFLRIHTQAGRTAGQDCLKAAQTVPSHSQETLGYNPATGIHFKPCQAGILLSHIPTFLYLWRADEPHRPTPLALPKQHFGCD